LLHSAPKRLKRSGPASSHRASPLSLDALAHAVQLRRIHIAVRDQRHLIVIQCPGVMAPLKNEAVVPIQVECYSIGRVFGGGQSSGILARVIAACLGDPSPRLTHSKARTEVDAEVWAVPRLARQRMMGASFMIRLGAWWWISAKGPPTGLPNRVGVLHRYPQQARR
jgi:hypothetical protein